MDPYRADSSFDGGDLDCGSGLLLLTRGHIERLLPGQLLEVHSSVASVARDLPAWCRLTGNELVSHVEESGRHVFQVSKGAFRKPEAVVRGAAPDVGGGRRPAPITHSVVGVAIPISLPPPTPVAPLPALAVMGVGSWPRPPWLLEALHE